MPDRKVDTFTLLNAITVSASGQSGVQDVSAFTEALLLIAASGKTGSPTVDITLKTSDASDGTFHLHTTVSQIAANGNVDAVKLTNIGRVVRLDYAYGGTGSIAITAKLVCKN